MKKRKKSALLKEIELQVVVGHSMIDVQSKFESILMKTWLVMDVNTKLNNFPKVWTTPPTTTTTTTTTTPGSSH